MQSRAAGPVFDPSSATTAEMPRATAEAPPVFVDGTGRRRKLSVLIGASLAVGLLASLGLILAGLFAGGPLPLPSWPDARQRDAGTGRSASPTARPEATTPKERDQNQSTAVPTRLPSPSTTPGATQPPSSVRPGRGDENRSSPTHKPGRSPGKPA